jgi:hypothetical protein
MLTTFGIFCIKRSFSTVVEDAGDTEINLWVKEIVTVRRNNQQDATL